MNRLITSTALLSLLAISSPASPSVNYTVGGSSGDWTLDFAIENTLPDPFAIDFWGVKVSGHDILASPGSFGPSAYLDFDILGTIYNNNWFDASFSSLPFGTTLSGFQVHVTDSVAPGSVEWFAFAKTVDYAIPYTGPIDVNNPYYPGFLGTAHASVPDSGTTFVMLGSVLVGLDYFRRKGALKPQTFLARDDL